MWIPYYTDQEKICAVMRYFFVAIVDNNLDIKWNWKFAEKFNLMGT